MHINTVKEFEANAMRKLPPQVYNYFASGAEDEVTLRQNESSFSSYKIQSKSTNKNATDLRTRILGHRMGLPFGFAPSAMHRLACQQGQQITAEVASDHNICLGISTMSTVSLGRIQQVNKDGLRLIQIYVVKDRKITETLVKLAQKYGFKGLIITVDAQVIGKRSRDDKNSLFSPNLRLEVLQEVQQELKSIGAKIERKYLVKERDTALDWTFVSWLRSITKLPIILKGVLSVQDAVLATKSGVNGVWISNHGGRQLDCVAATIDLLPSIAEAVRRESGKTEVYIDGGVRSGYDIFKCLAFGADYVFVGRPVIYSLVQKKQGLSKMVQILKQQLQQAMHYAGVTEISQISVECISGCNPSSKL